MWRYLNDAQGQPLDPTDEHLPRIIPGRGQALCPFCDFVARPCNVQLHVKARHAEQRPYPPGQVRDRGPNPAPPPEPIAPPLLLDALDYVNFYSSADEEVARAPGRRGEMKRKRYSLGEKQTVLESLNKKLKFGNGLSYSLGQVSDETGIPKQTVSGDHTHTTCAQVTELHF